MRSIFAAAALTGFLWTAGATTTHAQSSAAALTPTLSASTGSEIGNSLRQIQLPFSRWGGNLGVRGIMGPVGGYSNQTYPNSREPFVTGTLTYRLQAPGKRTLLQPELFAEVGTVLDLKDATDNNVDDQNEGHSYFGMGIANRIAAYLPGGSALYVGAGAGVFETSSFHLTRDLSNQTQGYDDQPYYRSGDYYAPRVGFQFFAGLQMKRGLYAQAILQDLGTADAYHYRNVGLVLGYRR